MFLAGDRKRQALRGTAEHPADIRMPLRIGSDEALGRFVDPLAEALAHERAGRITGRRIRLDRSGRPRGVEISLSLRSLDLKGLETLGRALEAMGAPCGSTAEMTETGLRHLFGCTEGLGVALPEDVAPESVARTCVAAIGNTGRFRGAAREDIGPMLYFYGESFVQMSARIARAAQQDPFLSEAKALRLG